ncbi:MAG TPA: hypothetical protein VED01_28490 [Burkholderiales bacterium]|nr:hypothetical protein [Burkholderiales bacterium]
MQLASRIFEAEDLEAAVELCFTNRWTDGLPVVPPTRGAIERILDYLKRDPQELVGVVPPRNGVATVEKIAINCAMAGCRPEYAPIVIAAVEAMLEERFNLNGVQTTTHACAPLCVVSGPGVNALGFNTREGALGHGCRPSATIGRAIRLVLWNIGGGFPGEPCKTTLGHPGYFSFCVAEDAESNPWEPLQVERGFGADETVVTITATTAPTSVATGAGYSTIHDVLYLLADSINLLGSNNITGGDMVLVMCPMAAKKLADEGLTKLDVKRGIMALATRPVHEARHRSSISETNPEHWSHIVDEHDDNAQVPFVRSPDNLVIAVSGGWGSGAGFCAVCAGWGTLGGRTVSRRVQFPE